MPAPVPLPAPAPALVSASASASAMCQRHVPASVPLPAPVPALVGASASASAITSTSASASTSASVSASASDSAQRPAPSARRQRMWKHFSVFQRKHFSVFYSFAPLSCPLSYLSIFTQSHHTPSLVMPHTNKPRGTRKQPNQGGVALGSSSPQEQKRRGRSGPKN